VTRPPRVPAEVAAAWTSPGCWNPAAPEFAAVANGVSLLMPHIEPYFVRSTRAVLDDLEPTVADEARAYMSQELAHQREHRDFNALLVGQLPRLALVERFAAWAYGRLERSRSPQFNLAFAAGSETIAYSIARWTHDHQRDVMTGAEPAAAAVFWWHLAEEVEHKSVAFDVHRTYRGTRRYYSRAMLVSLGILAVTTTMSVLIQLAAQRRLFHPVAWWRLTRMAVSFVFELGPTMAASALPGHHPSQLADPMLFASSLRELRQAS